MRRLHRSLARLITTRLTGKLAPTHYGDGKPIGRNAEQAILREYGSQMFVIFPARHEARFRLAADRHQYPPSWWDRARTRP
jgi:hypothetical protein